MAMLGLSAHGLRAAWAVARGRPGRRIAASHASDAAPFSGQPDMRNPPRHGLVLPPCTQVRPSLTMRPTRPSGHKDRRATAVAYQTESRVRAAPPAAHGLGHRVRVAVDVDEVLGQFVFALNQFCLHEYDMSHEVSDYWVYEFAKIWGCDQDRSNTIVHNFFKSKHFMEGIPVIPGAAQALTRLSSTCDLVVVTSRQHVIQDQTLNWLDRHFPGTFKDVYFGNHWSLEGVSRKKSDICRTVGAGVLIDDNPSYAMECAAAGIHVLLYDWNLKYPWSKMNGRQHPLIQVVRDWDEVEEALEQLGPVLKAKAMSSGTVPPQGMIQG